MSKVLVIGYKTYSFKNDNDEKVEGIKVSFLGERARGLNETGYLPLQASLKIDMLSRFKEVPGLYDAKFEMVPGKGNKPTLALTDFEFTKPIDLGALIK